MKQRYYLFIFLIVMAISTNCRQPNQEKDVAAAVEVFRRGIVDADKDLLENITADELVYGHSSGKVQNKAEFIAEIISGQPLDYITIDLANQTTKIVGNTAVVRHVLSAETSNNGTTGHLKIGNMLIWQKKHGEWKLIARQAYKI